MVCAPWFFAFGNVSATFGYTCNVLKYNFYINKVFKLIYNSFLEISFEAFANYKNNFSKTSFDGSLR